MINQSINQSINPSDNKFRGGRPFDGPPGNVGPAAVQKFLYVVLQRAVHENAAAHEYFASRGSRTWTSAAAMKVGQTDRQPVQWRHFRKQCATNYLLMWPSDSAALFALTFRTVRLMHSACLCLS